ncbi:hypothetical protein Rs2_04753 [Raphanus sativus]|nr:hypothetical protein Rs2_04753 [Raphanus sativus]
MRSLPSERLSLMEGCRFEFTYKQNRFKKVWYKAVIELEPLTKPKSRSRQRCVRVLKDDSLTPLTAFTPNASFRPIPTKSYERRVDIKEGSIVDADYKDGWWVGLVVKQIGDDEFLVLFDSPPDIVMFERQQLRVHLDWVDETWWVLPGRNVQFLRRLQENPLFISGALVEVSDKIDKGEVVWVPAVIIKEINDNDDVVDDDEDEEEDEDYEEEEEEDDEEEEEDDEEEEEKEEDEDDDEEEEEEKEMEMEEEEEKEEEDNDEEEEEEKEEEEGDGKKYVVKVCINTSSFEGIKKKVEMGSIRPRPPPFSAEELNSVEYIEVFYGTSWRQGRAMGSMFRGRCKVLLEATDKMLSFKISDIRPSKLWEDGAWKPRESPLTEGSEDSSSTFSPVSNIPPITPSPRITATPLIQTRENPMESPLTQVLVDEMSNSGYTSFSPVSNSPPVTPSPRITATTLIQTRENGSREDNNRKRKREQNLSSVEQTESKDITMVLPFEKKLPIWKTVESMEVFKTFPQSPHFTPLLDIREDAREMSAVGMMLTFSGLLEEVKALKLNNPITSLHSLRDSFTELEKHGFNVKVPMLRISKLLSLIDRQAKKMEELECTEKVTAEKESIKLENERKILELQKLNEEADKEIAQSKSCEATIGQQLEDVKLQFHTTASAPW